MLLIFRQKIRFADLRLITIALLALQLGLANATAGEKNMSQSAMANSDEQLILELKTGKIVIALFPDLAPKHVERIKSLAARKFYDGIVFHRVIDGFMAQTGDPTGTGTGGSELPDLPAEFSTKPHRRGILSMARSANPDSANSQFFIVLADSFFLDRQYTVWGEVIEGMEHVDANQKRRQGSQWSGPRS